jgi:hypothetical protein
MIKFKAISDCKLNDLTGCKIGKLSVIGISDTRNKQNRVMWDCICDCGNKKSIPADMLNKTLRGQTGSKNCTSEMIAPHLSKKGRVWVELEMEGYSEYKRPDNQGGVWYLANRVKINRII